MNKMTNLKDYIKCYENIIDDQICDSIVKDSLTDLTQFAKSEVGDGKDGGKYRNCYDKPMPSKYKDDIYKVVGNILKKYSQDFKYFYTGLTTEDTGYTHLLYKGSEGGEYTDHIDHFDLHPRILSCSLILNDNYEGGNFSFFEGEYIVKKKKGSAVVFPSNFCFPHAVTPGSNGDRHSLITWVH